MRFLLKIAFLLGLAALFLPLGRESDAPAEPGLSPIAMLYGAQQAISDLSGFCGRAPAACESGQQAIRFAGERIGDGVAIAYSLASGALAPDPQGAPHQEPVSAGALSFSPSAPRAYTPPATDPMTTAAVGRDARPGEPGSVRMPAPASETDRPRPSGAASPAVPARPPLPQAAPRA